MKRKNNEWTLDIFWGKTAGIELGLCVRNEERGFKHTFLLSGLSNLDGIKPYDRKPREGEVAFWEGTI